MDNAVADYTLVNYFDLENPTSPTEDEALISGSLSNASGWYSITNNTLLAWRMYGVPDIEDEGLLSPLKSAIDKAIDFCGKAQKYGRISPPKRVIPNGEGGLIFERWNKESQIYQTIEIKRDLSIYLSTFKNHKLIERNPILF